MIFTAHEGEADVERAMRKGAGERQGDEMRKEKKSRKMVEGE